jgi:hypothetical protein
MLQPRHEGRPDGRRRRWLGWFFVLASLGLTLLIVANQLGDPLEDPKHPLAEALGSFGYFALMNAAVVGGAGLLAVIRDTRRSGPDSNANPGRARRRAS